MTSFMEFMVYTLLHIDLCYVLHTGFRYALILVLVHQMQPLLIKKNNPLITVDD